LSFEPDKNLEFSKGNGLGRGGFVWRALTVVLFLSNVKSLDFQRKMVFVVEDLCGMH